MQSVSTYKFLLAMLGKCCLVLAVMGVQTLNAHAGSYDDFFKAAQTDNADKIKSLLQRGLDPNLIEAARGDSGLILALRENSMKVFDVLVNTRDVNLDTKSLLGDTALMIAAYKGNLAAVKILIEKGAQINQPGWTALHYAASIGNNEIVQLLLDNAAYIDAESPNRTTPIMMAARAGFILTVKLLLDEGADATFKNNVGMTAIDLARTNNQKDIAEGLTYRLKKAGKL